VYIGDPKIFGAAGVCPWDRGVVDLETLPFSNFHLLLCQIWSLEVKPYGVPKKCGNTGVPPPWDGSMADPTRYTPLLHVLPYRIWPC